MPTACAVLAAGLSSRYGSLKQLARIADDRKTLIQTALNSANRSRADYVYIVLGHGADEIMRVMEPGRAQIILNKEYSKGLSSSVRSAVSNLPQECQALVLMVADQPFLTSRLINRLIDAVSRDEKVRIASLAFHNEPRNPTIFRKEFFPLLERLSGDSGAREIVNENRKDVTLIDVKDERVFLDIDTFSNLKKIRRRHAGEKSKTRLKKQWS